MILLVLQNPPTPQAENIKPFFVEGWGGRSIDIFWNSYMGEFKQFHCYSCSDNRFM